MKWKKWVPVLLLVAGFLGCTAREPSSDSERPPVAGEKPASEARAGEAAEAGETASDETPATSPADEAEVVAGLHPALLDPSEADETAPDNFKVRFETTKGDFIVEVHRDWAPIGAERFYNLVRIGFLNDAAFFRVLEGFVVQFGLNGDPAVNRAWDDANIQDEPVKQSNRPGTLVFAKSSAPNSRTTQLFINLVDNSRSLDSQGFSAFGEVIEGMSVVESLYGGYGEGAPRGSGPSQARIQREGNAYLKGQFPELDFIHQATVIE